MTAEDLPTTLRGSCLCTQIRITITNPMKPLASTVCHCNECQKSSGVVFQSNIFYPRSDVEITTDTSTSTIATYVSSPPSGHVKRKTFCKNCGSTICWENIAKEALRDIVIVPLGILDRDGLGDEWCKPTKEYYCERRVKWLKQAMGAEQHSKGTYDQHNRGT